MSDTASYIRSLKLAHPLRKSVLRRAIQTLHLRPDGRILDAGCGIGLPALLLAESIGPKGRVTGLDIEPGFIEYAESLVRETGMEDRLTFRQGSVDDLPFEENAFDLVWSTDCVGYAPLNTPLILAEIRRVLAPGGRVALLFWSSQKILPGFPDLEARISATTRGILPFTKDRPPYAHPLRLLGRIQEAGFVDTTASTFSGDAHAPLTDEIREALLDLFAMLWTGIESEISLEDQKLLKRLIDPTSTDFILDLPDYYGFFTYSMFTGTAPE